MTPYQHVLAARLAVCEAFYYGGPEAAIEELTHASLELAPLIHEGGLMHSSAFGAAVRMVCRSF